MSDQLSQIRKKILPIFKRYGVIRADVFGSRARGRAGKGSDLDLAISLKKPIGLFRLAEMNDQLEARLQMKVDLLTHSSINRRLKPYIVHDMVRIYDKEQ
jgi:hypothetical protein